MTRSPLRTKLLLLWFSATIVYAVLLLIGPRVPPALQVEECVINVDLPGPFGISLNCDSPDFLLSAESPSRLLEPRSIRQSRPGMPVLAHIVSAPFVPLASKFAMPYDIGRKPRQAYLHLGDSFDPRSLIPYFGGYFLLNVFFLFLSLAIYQFLVSREWRFWLSLDQGAAWFGLVLIFNDVVKAHLWSPHTQVFNILVPLVAMLVFDLAREDPRAHRRKLIFLLCASGIGMLFYGSFILVLAGLFCALALRVIRGAIRSAELSGDLLLAVSGAVVCVAPYIGWYVYVVYRTGSFYQYEIEKYQQLVWVSRTFHDQGLLVVLTQLISNLTTFLGHAFTQGWGLLAVGVSLVAWLGKRSGGEAGTPRWKALCLNAVLTSSLSVVFFSLVGIIPARLSFSAVVPLVVLVGALLQQAEIVLAAPRRPVLWRAVVLSMFALMLFVAAKDGPYS